MVVIPGGTLGVVGGHIQSASGVTAQGAVNVKGISSGSNGFGTFAINAQHDGTNWTRMNDANEAWLLQGNSSAGVTGSFAIFHADPGSGNITWVPFLQLSGAGSVVLGALAALATGATAGFEYVPSMAGTPTGTPTAFTGKVPTVIDTTGSKLWCYIGGVWKSVTLA